MKRSSLQSPSTIRRGCIASALLLALTCAPPATAQGAPPAVVPMSDWPIDDADPERSVPSAEVAAKNPIQMGYLMMDLSDRAELAKRRGEHSQAAKYYRALGKAVPERAVSFSKACEAHEAAGELQEAAEMCRAALGRGGAKIDDHVRFVRVTLRRPGELPKTDVDDAIAVIERLRSDLPEPKGKRLAAELECELALRLEDAAKTRACIGALEALRAEPSKILAYEWALSLMTNDLERAQGLIARAERAQMNTVALDVMKRSFASQFGADAADRRLPPWWPAAAAGLLALGGAIALVRRRGRLSPGA